MKKLKEIVLYLLVLTGIACLIAIYLPNKHRPEPTIDLSKLKPLKILAPRGYFPDPEKDPVEFNEIQMRIARDIGVNLEIDYFESNDQLIEILSNKTKSANYDIAIPSDFIVKKLVREDLIEPIGNHDIPRISNIKDVFSNSDRFQSLTSHSVPFSFQTVGLMSNAWNIENILVDWNYLFKADEYNYGSMKFSIPKDSRVCMGIALIYAAELQNIEMDQKEKNMIKSGDFKPIERIRPDPNTTDRELINRARDVIKDMIQNHDVSFTQESDILSNHVDVSVAWSGQATKAMEQTRQKMIDLTLENNAKAYNNNNTSVREGYPNQIPKIRFASPAPGVIINFDCFVVVKGTQNRDLGLKFIDYLLKPEISAEITNYSNYANTNRHSKQFVDRRIANGPSYLIPSETNSYTLETLDVETEDYYNKVWDQILACYQERKKTGIR